MSSLTDSCIVFTLKMESVPKNTIFGLKMIVKSGLEKNILRAQCKEIWPEGLNWPGRLAGISEGASRISK